MLTKRENALAILRGEQPDYYGDFMDAMTFIPDPVTESDVIAQDGEIHLDSWGVEYCFPPEAPGKHPVGRAEGLVIKDIELWRDQIKVPDLSCLDWEAAKRAAAKIDRSEVFAGFICNAGLFERSHHLLGFEEALVDYLLYEDEMAGILRTVADFKLEVIRLVAQELEPDVIFYQDDWGSKTSLFLPPDLWRRLIKPLHTEIVQAAHACGMLFVHHADCYCQPLAGDMVEMGIDIWQGVIPQNDIVEIQRTTQGKLPMIGGVDGPKIDLASTTAEEIRAEVRRAVDAYCPGGRFFPGIANGRLFIEANHEIYVKEMAEYGRRWALEHPVGTQQKHPYDSSVPI